MKKSLLVLFITFALGACSDSSYNMQEELPNIPPVAVNAEFITQTEIEVVGQVEASDANGDSLIFELSEMPMNGEATVTSSGVFTYTPQLEFVGSDQFTVTVSDGSSSVASAIVSIRVEELDVFVSEFTREAFLQMANDESLRVNGRNIINDVSDPNAFDDLLMN